MAALGVKLRRELATALSHEDGCAQDWMLTYSVGEWPFPITCEGRMRYCAASGRPKCKRRVVMIVRGITQLARRLLGAGAPDVVWLLRACRGADISRAPHSVRLSAKTTARGLIRASPLREAYRDYWPGTTALKLPPSVREVADPQAEPSDLMAGRVAVSDADLSPHARRGHSGQSATDPPVSVERRIRGLDEVAVPPAPLFPLCAMGPPRRSAALVSDEEEPAPRRDPAFAMGRRRYNTQYSAVWHALFELFVPIERAMGPAYRLLHRERASALSPDRGVRIGPGAARAALATALRVIPLPAAAEEMDSLLRPFAVEVADALIRAITLRPGLIGRGGPGVVEPSVVLSGMIFASVTRALYRVRVQRFQSIDWSRMSSLFRGASPEPPALKVSDEKSPTGLEPVANAKESEKLRGRAPVQPGDHSRVWGNNSFVRFPAFGGRVSRAAAEQFGYRMPQAVKTGK